MKWISIGDEGFHMGIESVEDLIHEIFAVGEEFRVASNFLCPVKLSSQGRLHLWKKPNHFNEVGACGQQAHKINNLNKKML